MHEQFEHVIDELVRQIGAKGRLAREIRQEFTSHFYELSEELAQNGFTRDEIVAEAMRRFGNPTDIAKTLEHLYHIPMEKILKKVFIIFGACIALLIGIDAVIVEDFDSSDFQHAIEEKYDIPYELVWEYVHAVSDKPCKTDGIGLDHYLLAQGVFWCDFAWLFDENRFLWQMAGPTMTKETFSSLPGDTPVLRAAKMLASLQEDAAEGDTLIEKTLSSVDRPVRMLLDNEIVTLPAQQLGSLYQFEDSEYIEMLVVLQKNSTIPLVELPRDGMIPFAGIIGREPGDAVWTPLLDLTGSDVELSLPAGMGKMNVHAIFPLSGELFVDVIDDRGAGSGEGNLLRLHFVGQDPNRLWTYDPNALIEKWQWDEKTWRQDAWSQEACFYFTPEEYRGGSWNLTPSLECSDTLYGSAGLLTDATLQSQMNADGALTLRHFFGALEQGWYSQAALFYKPIEDDHEEEFLLFGEEIKGDENSQIAERAWMLQDYCEHQEGRSFCLSPNVVTLKEKDEETGMMVFDVRFIFDEGTDDIESGTTEIYLQKDLSEEGRYLILDPLPLFVEQTQLE